MTLVDERPRQVRPSGAISFRQGRLHAVAGGIATLVCVVVVRLVLIQVVQHPHYEVMAAAEHWRQTAIAPRRGDIVDAQGSLLATTVEFESLLASTDEVGDAGVTALALAPIVGQSADSLRPSLLQKQAAPIVISTQLSEDQADEIRQLGLSGLILQPAPRRIYPQGSLAAQVLGVVGVDNSGLSGLELQQNRALAGQPGTLVAERDSGGDAISLGVSHLAAPVDGTTVSLTLDHYVQWVAEHELTQAIAASQARSGAVVVLDPQTGSILALAGFPSFDPNGEDRYRPDVVARYPIPAVASSGEPGSAFALFGVAAAIETDAVSIQTPFLNTGELDHAGQVISDTLPQGPQTQTVAQSLVLPSRVGVAWAATRANPARYYDVLAALGFGAPTGVDLPGEAAGLLRLPSDATWSFGDQAVNALGKGVTVTPLQLATATAAIADGGARRPPYVVSQILSPGPGQQVAPANPVAALRPTTALALTRAMVAGVDANAPRGAGLARVLGYAVAGYGGTLVDLGGSAGPTTMSSFLGFAPAESPRFALYVQLAGLPSESGGGGVDPAARVFGAVARQLIAYYQIPPSRLAAKNGT
jgi:cell division protein FtsI (penicillin-binding protein 3)